MYGEAAAVEMEFNFGLAYDHPVDKPLPELSDGYGYNFGTCLWFKNKYGIGLGIASTKHELNGGERNPSQLIQTDSEKNIVYAEARYKFLKTERWEIFAQAGVSFSDKINGGDSSGSYIQYSDSNNYDITNIGYSGLGYSFGFSVYRSIKSYNRGYFVFASFRYDLVNYSRVQYYGLEPVSGGGSYLAVYEADSQRGGDSFLVMLGVVFRFDMSKF